MDLFDNEVLTVDVGKYIGFAEMSSPNLLLHWQGQ